MASRASVTVSMAAETSGILSSMSRVSRVREVDVVGQHAGVRGDEQDVVEGEGFLDQAHGGTVGEGLTFRQDNSEL